MAVPYPAFNVVEAARAAQPVQFRNVLRLRCDSRWRSIRIGGGIVSRVDEGFHVCWLALVSAHILRCRPHWGYTGDPISTAAATTTSKNTVTGLKRLLLTPVD